MYGSFGDDALEKKVKADLRGRENNSTNTCVDWYSEGESRTVEVNEVRVVVRLVGRKGRRGRIVLEAPTGAGFLAADR